MVICRDTGSYTSSVPEVGTSGLSLINNRMVVFSFSQEASAQHTAALSTNTTNPKNVDTDMPTKKERRRDPRVRVNWPVLIRGKGGVREGELRDISIGGAFIRSDKPLSPKERSKLFVVAPDRRTFKIYFEVVWLRVDCAVGDIPPCGMGVRFTRVARPERQQLTEIIAKHFEKKARRKPGKKKRTPSSKLAAPLPAE